MACSANRRFKNGHPRLLCALQTGLLAEHASSKPPANLTSRGLVHLVNFLQPRQQSRGQNIQR